MQISIEKQFLLKALFHQHSLIERRASAPVLSHVLIDAKVDPAGEDVISCIGTDLERWLVEKVPGVIGHPGAVTVSAHMFYDIVRKMPDGMIRLSTDSRGHLRVCCEAIDFTLPTLPAASFPILQQASLPTSLTMEAETLRTLIYGTRFSMSTEEARHSLNGIYFHHHENQWRAVATDAQRLALVWAIFDPSLLTNLPNVIIGRKTIGEIIKLLDECSGPVILKLSENQMQLSGGRWILSSRLVDGHFPDYWQALPQNHPYTVFLNVAQLEDAISRVSMVSFDKQRVIQFDFSTGSLVLSAHSPQYGSATEALMLTYDGPNCTLGFNPKSVSDICANAKGDTIQLWFKDSLSPVLFQDPALPEASYVLMPVPVQGQRRVVETESGASSVGISGEMQRGERSSEMAAAH